MKKKIKLAAVHSRCDSVWKDADPENIEFSRVSVQKRIEVNMEKMVYFLHEAGRCNVDLVCTHEDFRGLAADTRYMDFPELFREFADEIPGITTGRLGEISKEYGMYIAANYFEKEGDSIFNTSVLIGRSGEIAGKYRKVHLPAGEKWRVSRGEEFPVFQTDIGRIGFATCYDILFCEHCRALALNGADIIIHQTQGWGMVCDELGEALVRVRAAENSVYMLVAKNIQTGIDGKSCIISNYGNMLAESEVYGERLVISELEPDYDMINEGDFNSLFSGVCSLKARQALEREPSLYSVITDPTPPVLEQYSGIELQTAPDKVGIVYKKYKKYEDDIANNRPVEVKYHW